DGLEHIRLSIILAKKINSITAKIFTTKYNKWLTIQRPDLFYLISYINSSEFTRNGSFSKIGYTLERSILTKVLSQLKILENYINKSAKYNIYYTRKLSGFVQILNFIPSIYDNKSNKREPSELKVIPFENETIRNVFLSLLNSNLFYWLLTIYSDCRNLNKREINTLPFVFEHALKNNINQLSILSNKLMSDIQKNSKILEMNYENLGKMSIQCIYPKHSKPIIDEIDRFLAEHYGFTDEELDFIINYDIKYRMGKEAQEED
ncbi:MAG: SAM-dependent methyltransferase, partial [Candidatus Eremiobacterota bacterium]